MPRALQLIVFLTATIFGPDALAIVIDDFSVGPLALSSRQQP